MRRSCVILMEKLHFFNDIVSRIVWIFGSIFSLSANSSIAMDIREILRSYGIRATDERVQILTYLYSSPGHHTAESVFENLSSSGIALSRATVFATLNIFVQSGVIASTRIGESNSYFESNITPHAHFRCVRCGKIVDMPLPEIRAVSLPGGSVLQHEEHLYFGTCSACQSD